jgi:hypothetical protein
MKIGVTRFGSAVVALVLGAGPALATEYHVAVTGSDGNPGTAGAPFRNIQKAADVMQAGDICTVHAGLYREWVKPARGGSSEAARITYRAAKGEAVYISGAERITSWVQEGSVWKAILPNTTFGTFNPYSFLINGDYLTFGGDKHLGAVYLDGALYIEKLTEGEVTSTPGTWRATVDAANTTIWANFGAKNPNTQNTEINVRRYVFAPTVISLGYITVDGFHMLQAATNWAPPLRLQDGLLMTNWGFRWIIQNNELSDSRAVCLAGGKGTANGSRSIDRVGNHIVRQNIIRRCRQAGIAGEGGWVNSLIERNLIEDINPLRDFGGWEGGGIKIHDAIDVVIRNNVIRKIHGGPSGAEDGIWLDWEAQGSRITGNVLYEVDQSLILLEMDHGPNLLDNNVFIGSNLGEVSDACIYVHNLFATSGLGTNGGDGRAPGWFTPHTTTSAGSGPLTSVDNKYFNNIYAGGGVGGVGSHPGFASDYGVYYGGAGKTSWGDAHSVVSSFAPGVTAASLPNGVTVSFKTDSAPTDVACPLITRDFIGLASVTHQGIENHDGSGITIDRDLLGTARNLTHPTAGPLEAPAGSHTITLLVGPDSPLPGTGGMGTGGTGGTSGSGGTGGTGGMPDAGSGGTPGPDAGPRDAAGPDAMTRDSGGALDASPREVGAGTGGASGTGGVMGSGGSPGTGGTVAGTGGQGGTVAGTGGQVGNPGTGGAGTGGDEGGSGTGGGTRRSGSHGGCSLAQRDQGWGGLLGMAGLLALILTRRRRGQ